MKLKKLILLFTGLTLLVTGCYKDDIIALQKQIDEMSAFDLDRQVKEIEATIKMLQDSDFQKGIDAVSAALSEKETALQKQINDLNTQISAISSSSSSKVEELEAQIVGLTAQLAQVQSSIKVLEGIDLPQTVADLKTLIEKASGYDTEIATLKNQFAGLDLDKKLADIKAAYETAIATSKEEMENYFNSNFQKKFEELFSKTQETIEHWITESESFKNLISDFEDLQDDVISQFNTLGLRGKEIDSLKNMAAAVEYDIKKAIENAIQTLQVGDIKTLRDDTDSLKNAVAGLKDAVTELQELPGKIGDFNKLQGTLIEAIVALQEAAMADDQQTLKDLVLALKGCLLDANNELVSVKKLINDIRANSTQIAQNRDSIFINAEAIKAISTTISTLPTTDVTEGLAARIAEIENGVIGEKYNLADIVTRITKITTALSSDNGLIAVKEIVAKLNALLDQVGEPSDDQAGETIYGLIAGLNAKLSLFDSDLRGYVDAASNDNKQALKDSLVSVNSKLSDLDERITAIESSQLTSLDNRVKTLEDIVGTGALNTTATNLTDAINELIAYLGYQKGQQTEKTISDLIVALQADLSAIEGGLDPTSTNLLTLKTQAEALEDLLEGFGDIDFGSKKGVQALNELIKAVGSIQTTFADYVTTEFLTDTLDVYFTKTEANGLKQTLEEFKAVIGDGTNPDGTTILSRIAVLEAATVELGDNELSYADAIKAVFVALNSHVAEYETTQDVITGIQSSITTIEGDITAINALLKGEGESLEGFTATTVIGALQELKTGLGNIVNSALGTDALDSLATQKMVTDLETSVNAAHQALIDALLGVPSGTGSADAAGKLVQDLKKTLDDLDKGFWKFNIGDEEGEYTIQSAINELNSRISAVNALVGEGFKDEEGQAINLTDYIKGLETTLNSIRSSSSTALDNVKDSLVRVIGNVQTTIVKAVLGYEGTIDSLSTLNLKALSDKIKNIEDAYVTQDKLTEELGKISGDLGGLYTNVQIDSMVSAIINAFCIEEISATDRLDSLGKVTEMINQFKSDITKALVSIGDTTDVGSNLSDAIKALQSTIADLEDDINNETTGLKKAVADINAALNETGGIVARVGALETAINTINTDLGDVLTKDQVDSAILVLAKALYVGTAVEDTSFTVVRNMMQSFKDKIDKIDVFDGDIEDLQDAVEDLLEAVEGLKDADEDLQDAIDGLTDDLEELSSKLDGLENRVGDLEEKIGSLVDIVQSIVYIPEYEDGFIYVDGFFNEKHPQVYDNRNLNVEVDFRVNTFKDYIFAPEKYTFKGYITSTKKPTKAYASDSEGFTMTYLDFNKNILALQFNSKEITDPAFWSGNAGASIAVEIMETNGNSLTTEYIPLKLNMKEGVDPDPENPDEPQGVKFVVSPTERTVGNAGTQIEVKVTSAHYWILEGITSDPGIFNFDEAYGGISASIAGSQYSRPFFTGTQIVYFNIPAYTNTRATANGKEPGKALEYTFTFKEYDSSSTDRNGNPNGTNTGTATLKIIQTPRETQTLTTDPAGCWDGITVEWDETATTFVVIPDDQKNDFKSDLDGDYDWVNFDRVDGDAGRAEITLNFTERTKSKDGYYGEREGYLTLTAATGESRRIEIVQKPRPAGDFEFYEGESGETDVDTTGTAHTFAYNAFGEDSAYTFRVVPSDGLGDWECSDTGASAYTVSVDNPDADGVKLVTVYPNEFNADYNNAVEGTVVFTLADGVTKRTLKFVQSKRVESALTVAPDSVSFSWDGYKVEGGAKTEKDTAHVSVVAADGFNDWVVVYKPGWVDEITNNGAGIAVISVDNDHYNGDTDRDGVVTFGIKNGNTEYYKTVFITQVARNTDEETPTLTITSEDPDFDNGKKFNWNASESEEGVTISVASGFSGDLDFGDKSEGFDEWFTVTPEPTPRTKAAAPTTHTYTIKPNEVNNDWANDVVETIKFVSISDGGHGLAESEEATLTFTIKARGTVEGDGAAPTVKINNKTGRDSTIVFDHNGYVKGTNSKNSTIAIAAGTYSTDKWDISGDSNFDECFTLTENPANSGNYTVKVTDDSVLDNEAHEGTLTITPKADDDEAHGSTSIVLTFQIEEYEQTLEFTKQTASGDTNTIEDGATLEFGNAASAFNYTGSSRNSSSSPNSWTNIVAIAVTPLPTGDDGEWKAEITAGDFELSDTETRTYSTSWTVPGTSSSYSKTGPQTIYVRAKSTISSGTKTGTLKITSASDKVYTFTLSQVYTQTLSFKQGSNWGTGLEPGTSLALDGKLNSTYVVYVTPDPSTDYNYSAEITGGKDLFKVERGTNTNRQNFTITALTLNVDSEQTGEITFKSSTGKEYKFALKQNVYSQTLSFKQNNRSGTTLSPGSTLTLGAKSESEYVVYVTPNPNETGYSASIPDEYDDYFSVSQNGQTFTIKTKTNNLGTKAKTGQVVFKSGSDEEYTFTLSQTASNTLKDFLDEPNVNSTQGGGTIKVPAFGADYEVTVSDPSYSSAFNSLSTSIVGSTSKTVNLSDEITINVAGTRKSSNNSGSSTITVTLTLPDKSTLKVEYKYSFSRQWQGGSQVTTYTLTFN